VGVCLYVAQQAVSIVCGKAVVAGRRGMGFPSLGLHFGCDFTIAGESDARSILWWWLVQVVVMVVGFLVAWVVEAAAGANEQPAEAAGAGFDDVKWVPGVYVGFEAEEAAAVLHFWAGRPFVDVWPPGEGEDVEDGENSHFDAEECAWDADFDVWV